MQGSERELKGDITSLKFLSVLEPREMERALGYSLGRLDQGYAIALLRDPVTTDQFRLGGMSYFSGGREGLPAKTAAEDKRRPLVDDRVKREYDDGGLRLRKLAAAAINQLNGPDRTAKVLPSIRHDAGLPPSVQYPRGTGVPQWTLLQPKRFLIALEVSADGSIRAGKLHFRNAAATTIDDRMRLRHYLDRA